MQRLRRNGHEEHLAVTVEHPLWAEGRGWVGAGELLPGEQVLSAGGAWLRVGTATWAPARQQVYNLEVDSFHTYFVGGFSAWTHNANCNITTLKPGPHAKESIPAHRGRPTASEQRQVNELMQKHGCHTCGTKNPGTKSGNAIAHHQPPQALAEPKEFLPYCNDCRLRQGGEVLQELLRTKATQ